MIWQASEGTELRRWKAHEGEARISGWFPCWSVDWHPDGRQLATSGRDGLVKIWNPDANAQIHEFAGHSGDVHCVAWSPDGRQLASAGADHWVRVWDLSAVETVGAAKSSSATVVVQRHSARIWSLAWSPDGERLATASDDGSVRVWETQAGQPSSQPVLTLRQQRDTRGFWAWKGSTETPLVGLGHDSFVNAVVWSPDGRRIVSGGEDQTVRVWDARSGRELETLRPHRGSVESLAFSRDGMRLASAGKEGSLAIFEMQREPAAVILSESASDVQRLCWSPDGSRLLTGHHDLWAEPNYEALVWDVEKRQLLKRLSPLTAFPGTVGWSRLGNQVPLLESDSRLTFLDPNTGSKVGTFDAAGRRIYATDYDPQGYKLAIAVGEGWIYVLDAASRNVLNEYRPHRGAIADLAWSPDGRWIAAGSADAQVTVTDSETGELRWRLSGHTDDVRSITWSPDGQRLASGSDDRTIRIWDVQAGEQLQMLRGHSEAVKNVAWHPNGNRLASAAFDGMIKLWDTELWREILSLRAHVQGIVENSLQWSPDGRRLASGSLDRTIIIWQAAGIAAAESERRDRPMLKLAWRVLGLGGSLDLGDDVVSNLAALPQGELRGSLVIGALLIDTCSGCVYGIYWMSAFHVYSYAAQDSVEKNRLRIHPETRLSHPSRLVGPPYSLDITLSDLPAAAFAVELKSMTITTDDGQTFEASISSPVREMRNESYGRFVMLYASIKEGDWGTHPVLKVEYEILEPDFRTPESLTIPLRATHKSEIDFITAI